MIRLASSQPRATRAGAAPGMATRRWTDLFGNWIATKNGTHATGGAEPDIGSNSSDPVPLGKHVAGWPAGDSVSPGLGVFVSAEPAGVLFRVGTRG